MSEATPTPTQPTGNSKKGLARLITVILIGVVCYFGYGYFNSPKPTVPVMDSTAIVDSLKAMVAKAQADSVAKSLVKSDSTKKDSVITVVPTKEVVPAKTK